MTYYERKLPHWQPKGQHLFVTWRLYGSLPHSVLAELRSDPEVEKGRRFLQFDAELHKVVSGPHWLDKPEIATLVQQEILRLVQEGLCIVHSYVIMPNHVHMLLDPKVELRNITKAIKGRSAITCNQVLGRSGEHFWQDESYDHWVRNAESLRKIQAYIERNPVLAGLVIKPADWHWSSAHK